MGFGAMARKIHCCWEKEKNGGRMLFECFLYILGGDVAVVKYDKKVE